MMKYKNYIKVSVFVLIFITLLEILGIILSPKNNTKEAGFHSASAHGYLAEEKNTIDVLFIGDSLSYASFIPLNIYRDNGYTSYNLGTAAQRMYQIYANLEIFLEYHRPKVVVLETDSLSLDFNVSYAIYSELGRYFDFFDYHDRWKKLSGADFTSSIKYTYKDSNKGYKNIKKIQKAKNKKYMIKSDKCEEIDEGNIFYLKKIKRLLDKYNVELLIISTVSMKNMTYEKHNSYLQLSKKIEVAYLDLNLISEIDINWESDSYDGGEHLNYNGAVKVSSFIGNYLKENYNLPDHREDDSFASWNDTLLDNSKKEKKEKS